MKIKKKPIKFSASLNETQFGIKLFVKNVFRAFVAGI